MNETGYNSKTVAGAALRMAITGSRLEEGKLKEELAAAGIKATAVDYGGDYHTSVLKVVERAVVAARREGIISPTHQAEGGVAG
ncbi:MAG TPA: hut operon positive regulator HutP, partial [Firmicutes bacterium]|nr:hut operon positive regulator HutP [Bacillota bacterium]